MFALSEVCVCMPERRRCSFYREYCERRIRCLAPTVHHIFERHATHRIESIIQRRWIATECLRRPRTGRYRGVGSCSLYSLPGIWRVEESHIAPPRLIVVGLSL